ncbi:metalloregulator ArsR/SmtB family transcription factor [Marinicella rhabdoformis]|uniref:metalloregulator ArsR/SmtB family transcription factor n=1 Tax=Marinicella rhabdoformis TaxID=2580566 RepID=UPI0012AEC250|nr:metalloregulator ArsR/SmtB family transcription factor [Marinicella rhabdoformis]
MSEQQSIFSALADPHRRTIINLLKEGEKSVSELSDHFDFSGATLSHHLNVLKSAELVRVRKDKQKRIYTLNMSVVEEMLLLVKQLFY